MGYRVIKRAGIVFGISFIERHYCPLPSTLAAIRRPEMEGDAGAPLKHYVG